MKMCKLCSTLFNMYLSGSPRLLSPDDDDDTVKDVVGIAEVIKETKGSKFQDHLQGKHACKDNVADLQDVGQFLWLERRQSQRVRTASTLNLREIKHHHSQGTSFLGICEAPIGEIRVDLDRVACTPIPSYIYYLHHRLCV